QRRGGFELGRLPRQRLAGIILRERDIEIAGFAAADPDQLLFETWNEGSGADHNLNVLTGAAIEWRAVDGALEGDRDPVAGLGLCPLAPGDEGPILVGNALDGFINIGLGDLRDRLFDGKALE